MNHGQGKLSISLFDYILSVGLALLCGEGVSTHSNLNSHSQRTSDWDSQYASPQTYVNHQHESGSQAANTPVPRVVMVYPHSETANHNQTHSGSANPGTVPKMLCPQSTKWEHASKHHNSANRKHSESQTPHSRSQTSPSRVIQPANIV